MGAHQSVMQGAINQVSLLTLRTTQLAQAAFLQKNQMLQNGFLIFVTLR
jgi:hypothetical protein